MSISLILGCEGYLKRGVVMVEVGEGWVVSVNVEGDREQLRHDAVVGDQGGQAGVHLQETLHIRSIKQKYRQSQR